MEGVTITDLTGRRILSTHFASPLRANLAFDAAVTSSQSIVWIPATTGVAAEADDDSSDDGDERNAWDDSEKQPTRGGAGRGIAVCQIIRNGLRFMTPVARAVDPVIPLTFLTDLYHVLEFYIDGPVTEATVKDNFDIVLALLHEMLAGGRPQLTQSSQLKEFVTPPDSQLLAKVATAVNAATSGGIPLPSQASAANALVASPLPWRRQGIKYTSNDVYLDLTETLSALLDPSGKPLVGSISGQMDCRSRLSGMPDLALTFTDPAVLGEESAAFHSCVRYHRWRKEKVVSFVPPDGAFTLLTFQHTPPLPLMTTTSARLAAALLLPFSLTSSHTLGPIGGALSLNLTARTALTNLVIRIPLASPIEAPGQVQVTVSGGALLRDDEGRSIGGGAGRWEVIDEEVEEHAGELGAKRKTRYVLVWRIDKLSPSDRPAVLTGQYNTLPGSLTANLRSHSLAGARKPPAFTLTFDSPSGGFSGLRVDSLKLLGETYNVYKGVKTVGKGTVEIRT
ncbi:hypothetical protein BMF94_1108 [Rhodotorula taiwanensis]|uniref:MHD domain-containing protein n=1 Tax=Rhodotorula taiwanensis TaxID=741276 RepID=A0A2S5BG99_9BASI|nr:hypothetical protein BMF94_1108 [Rhodotorula taiwanensis]